MIYGYTSRRGVISGGVVFIWSPLPVRVAVAVASSGRSSDEAPDEEWEEDPPERPVPLERAVFLEALPPIPHAEFLRRLEAGEDIPDTVTEEEDGFHPARQFEPPLEWILHLLQAVSTPEAPGALGFPSRRRRHFWPYEEA